MAKKNLNYEEAEIDCLITMIQIVETDNHWEELRDKGLDKPLKGWE